MPKSDVNYLQNRTRTYFCIVFLMIVCIVGSTFLATFKPLVFPSPRGWKRIGYPSRNLTLQGLGEPRTTAVTTSVIQVEHVNKTGNSTAKTADRFHQQQSMTTRPMVKVDKFGNRNSGNASSDPRQESCKSCFQHNFKRIIDNRNLCRKYQPNQVIDLVILITTIHSHTTERDTIRNTWLTVAKGNRGNVRYAFLLGETDDEQEKVAILEENEIHGDIIKEDFKDHYSNLTYKTIMGLKWASTRCDLAKYVMKTDDDMFVNVPNLLKFLKQDGSKLSTAIAGACSLSAGPIRDKNSKWYASVRSYPSNSYPGFCSGTGYVTSLQVARKVSEVSPNVPFFHLEDVYVAICIRKLGYRLIPTSGFNSGRPNVDYCLYKGGNFITVHYVTPKMLTDIWKKNCT